MQGTEELSPHLLKSTHTSLGPSFSSDWLASWARISGGPVGPKGMT